MSAATRKRWTPEQIELVRVHYPHETAKQVAQRVGLRVDSVYRKAADLGIVKSAEFLASVRSGRVQRGLQSPGMIASQFKPGFTPWNKGRRGVNYPGMQATQFKPGWRPHTWVPVGSYRITSIDRYLERKVTDLPGNNNVRWTPVHRLVWEAEHGPIPRGHIVVFKPGCKTTELDLITADRLECITRAENARRNHSRNKHPELAKLVQLKGAITRQVNRIRREDEQRKEAAL